MERFWWRISVDGSNITLEEHPSCPPEQTGPNDTFDFAMCGKNVTFGKVKQLRHVWIDLGKFNTKGSKVSNEYARIVDFYVALCRGLATEKTALTAGQEDTVMFAKLLPHVGRINSTRLIKRSILRRKRSDIAAKNLQLRIQRYGLEGMSSTDFRKMSEGLLGPKLVESSGSTYEPHQDFGFDSQVLKDRYTTAIRALSNAMHEDIAKGEGSLPTMQGVWQRLCRKARRRGLAPLDAAVVDMISAEAHTAFVVCYSAFWDQVVIIWEMAYGRTTWGNFHRLWHTEPVWSEEKDSPNVFTLFSGNCFALHPVGGLLLRTQTGREIVGEMICLTEASPPDVINNVIARFLLAMYTAIAEYEDSHLHQLASRSEQGFTRRNASLGDSIARQGPRYRGNPKN